MRSASARHDEIVRNTIEGHDGHVVKTTGDGFHAVFANAQHALAAASDAQVNLQNEGWEATGPLRVRMGLHTCEVELRDGDYYGSAVNRAARLMSVAHGGQVVMSAATAELAREAPFELRDLGEHRLAGLSRPERVTQLCPIDVPPEFPPLRSVDTSPGNLPRQVTSFVGRDRELEMLADLVRTRPLVTLTGVGGVGKTRLALEVAADTIGEFADGAWLCELAPVTDPGAVWDTLAETLRVFPAPGRTLHDLVLGYLAEKRALMVLDNCEHLLDAAVQVVNSIARRCPYVAVLATSREGLAVPGEQVVAVPSLGLPAVDVDGDRVAFAPSVQLFCDRARSAKNGFDTSGRSLEAVAVLCRRLDGIPLAIELAAARAASMSPEDLVARLDQRFKLLARGSRASMERHQTLRNTIDWSYELLDDAERDALQGLSVFAGGSDLTAAESVLSGDDIDPLDVADLVRQLVDKSLVIADADDEGSIRYRMFESIRQYAAERLEASGRTPSVRARHADYYVELSEAAAPKLRSRDQLEWARRVAREVDNFRVALDWAVEAGSADRALRLVAALAVNGVTIGYSAMDWAETAVDVPGAHEHELFPAVASWAIWSATLRDDLLLADALVSRLDAAETARGQRSPFARQGPTTLAFFRGDAELARRRAEEWVALARLTGSPYEIAFALIMSSTAQRTTGDGDLARASTEEALQIARAAAIPSALSNGLITTVMLLTSWIDEPDRALDLLAEAIQIGTEIGDRIAVVNATGLQGAIATYHGDYVDGLRAAVASAEEMLRLGQLNTLGNSLGTAAVALAGLGRAEPAAVLLGTDHARSVGASPEWIERVAETEAALAEELGGARFESLGDQGAALTPREAVAYLVDAARGVMA